MINNKLCDHCNHLYVCNKLKTINKFDNECKTFIGVDISMVKCVDFVEDLEEGEISNE